MLKHLPSDKAAGPDYITNRILQASGEQAIDMIYLYMLIIWEVETYPGAWASALMQPIYKGGGKDRHSLVSFRGIYLLNTLTKLFEGLMETCLSEFTELHDTLTPSQQGSRITRQTHDAIYARIATIQERSQYGFPSYCCFIDFATAYPSVHRERLGLTLKNYKITGKIGTYSKKTPEVYEFGFSMPSLTKMMKWTFSAVSQKEADLAPPSLASAWQNLS